MGMKVYEEDEDTDVLACVKGLSFSYGSGTENVLDGADFTIKKGQRVLVVGRNGAGKSSFLRTFCGLHNATWDSFHVYGKDTGYQVPWCDQHNGLAYLGGEWASKNAFSGPQPFYMDIKAGEMMKHNQEKYKERRDELVKVLGIDLNWNMGRVSDGQRKKVRIMLKLIKPFKVCVIDEFIVELDILSRTRFLEYLTKECEERGCCIIYCSHIFDQLDDWTTHIVFLSNKKLSPLYELQKHKRYVELCNDHTKRSPPLFRLVMEWLIEEAGDFIEPEEVSEREFDIYDSGYEAGRSALMFAVKGDPTRKVK